VIAEQNRLRERERADQIDKIAIRFDGSKVKSLGTDEEVRCVVTNGSRRPIRYVACRLEAFQIGGGRFSELANVAGEFRPVAPASVVRQPQQSDTFPPSGAKFRPLVLGGPLRILRAVHVAGFTWNLPVRLTHPAFLTTLRFTDDAGLHWEIDGDLHLHMLAERDR
jgi:hypothetical protein